MPQLKYIMQFENEGHARAAMARLAQLRIAAESVPAEQVSPGRLPDYVDLDRGGWLIYVDPARWNDAAMGLEEMQQYPERD
ncbi:MAG: hypothetical protein ACLFUJ_00370 [Phycisphaerae bacterium]